MEVQAKTIDDLFRKEAVYEVPIYQRLYVWDKENHWQPLWDDMQRMAETFFDGAEPKIHFLGASVQQVTSPPSREVETNLVIDGQQRLTTLQISLKAFRDVVRNHSSEYYEKLDKLTKNEYMTDESSFKILSTMANYKDFRKVMECEDKKSLLKNCGYSKEKEARLDNILMAYFFFYNSIGQWLDEAEESKINKKIESLYKAITKNAKLAVIYIDDKEDDAQLIFEKLNTGGKPLLASDLVKNSLLMELQKNGKNANQAYLDYWKYFDVGKKFWQDEVRAGPGGKRARIEVYLKHVLALLTKKEVLTHRVYKTYRGYAANGDLDALQRMEEIHRFGQIYEKMQTTYGDPKIQLFLDRLHAMDGGAAYPFLLKLFDKLSSEKIYLVEVLEDLESFLVRRMVCGLTNKNYNSVFVDILDTLDDLELKNIPGKVREKLKLGTADVNKWPDNDEFKKAWIDLPLYKTLNARRVGLILAALEDALQEYHETDLSKTLTIEHVLPQGWHPTDWPLPKGINEIEAKLERDHILHTIGNLTLLDGKMNIEQSNKPWISNNDPDDGKRAMLQEHSRLILNKKLCVYDEWNEETIRGRSVKLFDTAKDIWPRPE